MESAPPASEILKPSTSSQSTVVVSSGSTVKAITGIVSSGGSVVGGTGFGVVRTSAGQYTITFTTAFAAQPVVLVTVLTTVGTPLATVVSGSSTTTGFQVTCASGGGVADQPFNFVAYPTA